MSAKEFRPILEQLALQGWRVEMTASGHWRAAPPDPSKPVVHFSSKSSDYRAVENTIHDLKRSGFEWPPPSKREARERDPAAHDTNVVEFVAAAGSEPEPEPETPEQRMERAFAELKEARGYLALAKEQLVERQLRRKQAVEEERVAEEEWSRATIKLADAKAEFDRLFEGGSESVREIRQKTGAV